MLYSHRTQKHSVDACKCKCKYALGMKDEKRGGRAEIKNVKSEVAWGVVLYSSTRRMYSFHSHAFHFSRLQYTQIHGRGDLGSGSGIQFIPFRKTDATTATAVGSITQVPGIERGGHIPSPRAYTTG